MNLVAATCCAKWKALSEGRQDERVWQYAHHLHHNVKRRGASVTAHRLAELAEVTEGKAKAVLDEAVQLKWFKVLPPNPAFGQMVEHYISPAKPK